MRKNNFLSKLTPGAIVAIILVLALAGGTVAWLQAQSSSITNTFTVGTVDVDIEEDFDHAVKSDVTVTNPENPDTNVPIYVRVALVPTWVNDDGNPVGVSASLADLSIDWGTADWIYTASDGYYYYKHVLPVGGTSFNLIDTATVTTSNGYKLELKVIADAVQAYPENAAESVWPVSIGSDGTLSLGGGN